MPDHLSDLTDDQKEIELDVIQRDIKEYALVESKRINLVVESTYVLMMWALIQLIGEWRTLP